ncbi:aminoacyl-tRNA deacylase [Marinobacter sp. 1Y8]
MPVQQLKEFLDTQAVSYTCLSHSPAFTAQELSQHAGLGSGEVVKTVIIELDGKMAMVVMPATWRIRWDQLSRVLDTDFVQLADEEEFKDRFPNCEVGAMPPFGNLFGMTVYCCEALTTQSQLAFPAGSHGESIRMTTRDFLHLVSPMVINKGFKRPDAPCPAWLRKVS